ncbi:GrpB family protein [Maricaulis salignorans]|uniref:GrpB domain, predicted nucleotidyltransferase, UPF0157 family n=1 Tax=Maricaulis salignorans TaxID=144026 RepID=A0A1G9T9G5_9PROT|nr:GrpB family protein [Maricaulis salignorans]SDM44327.1 GrpB domain, predicted nucleotidyltransferase, UPF0157 family [Maricaulis salignorans]
MTPILVAHNPSWARQYRHEAAGIRAALGANAVDLHHIGSTSIPGILAKPVIDMLGAVTCLDAVDECVDAIGRLGYEAKGEFGLAGRRYFRKHDDRGQRTHHLHIYARNSADFSRHLVFRDFLLAFPEQAKRYSEFKAKLVDGIGVRREDYQAAKSPFVADLERQALAWSQG